MRPFKIIVEKHPDGYVAYPFGLKGVAVGEGYTYEEALVDVNIDASDHAQSSSHQSLYPMEAGRNAADGIDLSLPLRGSLGTFPQIGHIST